MSDKPIAHMDIKEFRERGYLQEVNRLFFHPLGLALAVRNGNEGEPWTLDHIWDCRDDPEGICFEDLTPAEVERGRQIEEELRQRSAARIAKLGYVVQPLEPGP